MLFNFINISMSIFYFIIDPKMHSITIFKYFLLAIIENTYINHIFKGSKAFIITIFYFFNVYISIAIINSINYYLRFLFGYVLSFFPKATSDIVSSNCFEIIYLYVTNAKIRINAIDTRIIIKIRFFFTTASSLRSLISNYCWHALKKYCSANLLQNIINNYTIQMVQWPLLLH